MERKTVTVQYRIYGLDDYTIDEVHKKLKEAEKEFKQTEKGVENIRFTYRAYEEGCSYSYTEFFLEGKRPENDTELKKRLAEEAKMVEYRKAQYENLKREFEEK